MDANEIKARIERHFPEAEVSVSGEDGKYTAVVISPQFAGRSAVQRHQMVYAAVSDQIASGELHALSIQARAPSADE